MQELSIYDPEAQNTLAQIIKDSVQKPVYLCIGTDKVFSDSLGPRVGTLLNEKMTSPGFVYGLCDQNITAENLLYCYEFVRKMHPDNPVLVIDAAVGTREQIGRVQISQDGIIPGAATNKNLPQIGDVSIVGIVADKGMEDFYTLNSSKEKLVNEVAQFIVDSILQAQTV